MDEGLAALERSLRAAGAGGADVLVMPEIFLPGYNQPDIPQAARSSDAWADIIAPRVAAAGTALVIGLPETWAKGTGNSALAFGADGSLLAVYRKIQLYGPRERALYIPGDDLVLIDLAGVRCGLLICYDVEFAPHVAALAARGAEVILVPTANMMPFTHVPEHTVPAMAANHGVAIAYANWCGTEGDLTYTGSSLIAGPHGEVLARAGQGPALLVADLPARDPARLSTQAADFRRL
jgi:predicted amidohydrolase